MICVQYIVVPTAQHKVRQGVNKTLADVVAWSLSWASRGIYPSRGFYGERFDSNMYRSSLSGKQIAGGYKLLEKKHFFICFLSGMEPNPEPSILRHWPSWPAAGWCT